MSSISLISWIRFLLNTTSDIDYGLYVLNVDLWSADGLREVNLVRHSATSPAISSTIPTSYAQTHVLEAPLYPNPLPVPAGHQNIARDPQYSYHHYGQQQTSNGTANGQNQSSYNPYPQQPQVNPYSQQPNQQPQTPRPLPNQYGQHQPSGYPPRPADPVVYNPPSRFPDPPNHHIYFHTGTSVHPIASNTPRAGEYVTALGIS